MKTVIPFALILSLILLLGSTSCIVIHEKGNNGKKKGWYKKPKNATNPGNNKVKVKENGKVKVKK